MTDRANTPPDAPSSMSGPLHAPFPGYVQSAEQRLRWKVCASFALARSMEHEPDGRPNAVYVWHGTRQLYSSDLPTGDPDAHAVAAVDDFLSSLKPFFP